MAHLFVELLPAFGLGISVLVYFSVLKPLWKRLDSTPGWRYALAPFKAAGTAIMVVVTFPVVVLAEWLPAWLQRRPPKARDFLTFALVVAGYFASLAVYLWFTEGWDWRTYVGMVALVTAAVSVIAVPCALLSVGAQWRRYSDRRKRIAGCCATASGLLWLVGFAAMMIFV